MRSWLSLALLSAVVAALGLWVYLKPAANDANTHALSALQVKDVKRLRIERLAATPASPQSTIELERNDSGWRLAAPLAARADTTQVERVLGILEARSAARYAAADLARYGLDQPQARLTIDGQVFTYGAINEMTREQYVHASDTVYAVPVARTSTLPRDADALLARTLFSPGEIPVRFELPGVAATLDNGVWKVSPDPHEASADERNAWVDSWRNAMAMRAIRHDGAAVRGEVRVTLKDGRTLELGIVRREPELVLVRVDEGVQFHLFAAHAKRLLSPPGAK